MGLAAIIGAIPGIGNIVGGIGSALIGSRRSRKNAERAEANNDPANIRAKFEAAGLHPYLGFQGGWDANPGAMHYAMSTEHLMNGLAAAGDGMGEVATLTMQNTRQEQEKQRLENLVREATLGADIGGVYSQPRHAPMRSDAVRPPPTAQTVAPSLGMPGAVVTTVNPTNPEFSTDVRDDGGALMQTLTMPDGTVREYPVGFDMDEMLTGMALRTHDFMSNRWDPEHNDHIVSDALRDANRRFNDRASGLDGGQFNWEDDLPAIEEPRDSGRIGRGSAYFDPIRHGNLDPFFFYQ